MFLEIALTLSLGSAGASTSTSPGTSAGTSGGNAPSQTSQILSLQSSEVKFPNGFRVFMVKYPSPGVVAYQLPVHAGSRNEIEVGKTGFAHFFEHLMFRGTQKRTSKEFGDLYTKLGCENNAWTSNDMTNYHGVVAKLYLPQILDAEADRFMHLSFDEKALRDEAGAVLGEYNKDVAQPEFALEEKLASTAFRVHPYAHTTMGYKEDILKFTERYRDVWPFFKNYYRPSNVSLILVGDVDFDRATKLAKMNFGDWKNPEHAAISIPNEPEQTEARDAKVTLTKPTQTRLSISYKVPAFSTKTLESASLEVLSEMLFSVTSEFQKQYRFEKKWLDAVSATSGESLDPGLWTINLRLSEAGHGKGDELLQAVEKTIESVRLKPASTERLEATKRRFKNAALTNWFASPDALADRIAWYTNFESDLGVINRVLSNLSAVTSESVQKFAQDYLKVSRRTIITLEGAGSTP